MTDQVIVKTDFISNVNLEVIFAKGELNSPGRLIELLGDDICFVVDQGFLRARKDLLIDTADSGWHSNTPNPLFVHGGGERNRTWNELRLLLVWFNKHHIKRTTTVVAVGGEATLNIAGAAAALWKSGIKWIAVPTSLQLIVNNHLLCANRFGFCDIYNLLGIEHKPTKIYIDPDLVSTMSYRRIVEGLLDATKLALFSDAEKFQWILDNAEKLVIESEPNQQTKLFHLADVHYELINWAVVENTLAFNKCPHSSNTAVMPLDMLYGRALEEISLLKIQSGGGFTNPKAAKMVVGHARALAAGVILAHNFAHVKGLLESSYIEHILKLFENWNLPTQIYPGWRNEPDKLWTLMNASADANGFQIDVAIPVSVGKIINTHINKDDFLAALNHN